MKKLVSIDSFNDRYAYLETWESIRQLFSLTAQLDLRVLKKSSDDPDLKATIKKSAAYIRQLLSPNQLGIKSVTEKLWTDDRLLVQRFIKRNIDLPSVSESLFSSPHSESQAPEVSLVPERHEASRIADTQDKAPIAAPISPPPASPASQKLDPNPQPDEPDLGQDQIQSAAHFLFNYRQSKQAEKPSKSHQSRKKKDADTPTPEVLEIRAIVQRFGTEDFSGLKANSRRWKLVCDRAVAIEIAAKALSQTVGDQVPRLAQLATPRANAFSKCLELPLRNQLDPRIWQLLENPSIPLTDRTQFRDLILGISNIDQLLSQDEIERLGQALPESVEVLQHAPVAAADEKNDEPPSQLPVVQLAVANPPTKPKTKPEQFYKLELLAADTVYPHPLQISDLNLSFLKSLDTQKNRSLKLVKTARAQLHFLLRDGKHWFAPDAISGLETLLDSLQARVIDLIWTQSAQLISDMLEELDRRAAELPTAISTRDVSRLANQLLASTALSREELVQCGIDIIYDDSTHCVKWHSNSNFLFILLWLNADNSDVDKGKVLAEAALFLLFSRFEWYKLTRKSLTGLLAEEGFKFLGKEWRSYIKLLTMGLPEADTEVQSWEAYCAQYRASEVSAVSSMTSLDEINISRHIVPIYFYLDRATALLERDDLDDASRLRISNFIIFSVYALAGKAQTSRSSNLAEQIKFYPALTATRSLACLTNEPLKVEALKLVDQLIKRGFEPPQSSIRTLEDDNVWVIWELNWTCGIHGILTTSSIRNYSFNLWNDLSRHWGSLNECQFPARTLINSPYLPTAWGMTQLAEYLGTRSVDPKLPYSHRIPLLEEVTKWPQLSDRLEQSITDLFPTARTDDNADELLQNGVMELVFLDVLTRCTVADPSFEITDRTAAYLDHAYALISTQGTRVPWLASISNEIALAILIFKLLHFPEKQLSTSEKMFLSALHHAGELDTNPALVRFTNIAEILLAQIENRDNAVRLLIGRTSLWVPDTLRSSDRSSSCSVMLDILFSRFAIEAVGKQYPAIIACQANRLCEFAEKRLVGSLSDQNPLRLWATDFRLRWNARPDLTLVNPILYQSEPITGPINTLVRHLVRVSHEFDSAAKENSLLSILYATAVANIEKELTQKLAETTMTGVQISTDVPTAIRDVIKRSVTHAKTLRTGTVAKTPV